MKLEKVDINFSGKVNAEILKCLETLYSTYSGTWPLDRDFGIDIDLLDKPLDVFVNEYVLEVFEKTKKYEPRVEVLDVDFSIKEDSIYPKIYLELVGKEGSDEL